MTFVSNVKEYANTFTANPSRITFTPKNYGFEQCVDVEDTFNTVVKLNNSCHVYLTDGTLEDNQSCNSGHAIMARTESADANFDNKYLYGGVSFDDASGIAYYCRTSNNCNDTWGSTLYEKNSDSVDFDFWLRNKPVSGTTLKICEGENISGVGYRCKSNAESITISPSTITLNENNWYQKHTVTVKALRDSKCPSRQRSANMILYADSYDGSHSIDTNIALFYVVDDDC